MTPSAVWRVLTGGMVAAIVLCASPRSIIALGSGTSLLQILLLLFGGGVPRRHRRAGSLPALGAARAAGATALLGVGFFLVGVGLVARRYREAPRRRRDRCRSSWPACSRAASPAGDGAARSSPGSRASRSSAILGRLPHGRVLWLLAGAVLTGLAARHLDDERLAPSHRIGAAVLTVIGIGAVYAAANAYSLDERLFEHLARLAPSRRDVAAWRVPGGRPRHRPAPLAVLAWGLRSRRTFVLDTGIVLLALSLVTLRHYVHVAPLWVALSALGRAARRASRWPSSGRCAAHRRERSPGSPPIRCSRTSAAAGAASSCRW